VKSIQEVKRQRGQNRNHEQDEASAHAYTSGDKFGSECTVWRLDRLETWTIKQGEPFKAASGEGGGPAQNFL
jgi:hypothetical protein